jgi:hypothetical protein
MYGAIGRRFLIRDQILPGGEGRVNTYGLGVKTELEHEQKKMS